MGMTIDKAIPKLQFVRNALNDDMEIAKAYDLSIETMCKYQKIEQIYKEWFSDAGHTSAEAYERIGEVLKNGNVD